MQIVKENESATQNETAVPLTRNQMHRRTQIWIMVNYPRQPRNQTILFRKLELVLQSFKVLNYEFITADLSKISYLIIIESIVTALTLKKYELESKFLVWPFFSVAFTSNFQPIGLFSLQDEKIIS